MSRLLDGRYQFIKVLGSHELGQTYLVGNIQLPGHPKCVVKRLQLPNQNPRTLQFVLVLLKKKAESLKRLGKHDQIPQILDYFEEGNNFYLVEEFVAGRSLAEEVVPGQPLPEAQVVQLLWEVLEILVAVQGLGLVHRSIKPSSLIRRHSDGSLVLTGFGVFKEIGAQAEQSAAAIHTNGASVYQPSDQVKGQLQFNTDLYAVGIIAIQALTGLSVSDLSQRLQSGINGTSNAGWRNCVPNSPQLANILDRLIHPEGKQRYRLASEVLDDLRPLAKPAKQNGTPSTGLSDRSSKSKRSLRVGNQAEKNRFLIPAALALAAVVGGIALFANRLPQSWIANYWLQQGITQAEQGHAQVAIDHYTQAINVFPSGRAYFNRGSAYYQQGDRVAALDDLTQAIQLAPNQPEAFYLRGNTRYGLGDQQGAISDYTEAIRLNPEQTNAYVNRGSVRADLGDEKGAVADYTQALQIDPNLTAAYLNRCLSRSNLNDHQGAIADCTQAINLQPNSVRAYQNRGLVRRRLGDATGAIADFNIAIKLDPEDADPYYNRGLARLELGDRLGAVEDYSRAIELNPDHVLSYYDRGLARKDLGDRQGAIADFQQSATLCLNSGRTACYQDAQFQLRQLQTTANP